MPNYNGNPGNEGGGRKSAYQERADADFLWSLFTNEINRSELKAKLNSGKYSLKDAFVSKGFSGSERVLCELFRKLFPDEFKHEHSGSVEIEINGEGIYIHTLRSAPVPEGSAESSQEVQSDSVRTEVGQDHVSSEPVDTGSIS